MSFSIGSTNDISSMDLSSMDLETAMMAVQSRRSQLLENELQSQLNGVNERNQKIASMNDSLNSKRSEIVTLETAITSATAAANKYSDADIAEMKATREALQGTINKCSGARNTDWVGLSNNASMKDNADKSVALQNSLSKFGIGTGGQIKNVDENSGSKTMDATIGDMKKFVSSLDSLIASAESSDKTLANLQSKKASLQADIDNLKTSIDGESNSQQMDMLRLQSLSNKRNEAFDLMTNFVKKMQDNRSNILGNMR